MRAVAGDRRRLRAILLLACVLGLDSADLGTLGAVAAQLERSLHINDLQLGILASVVSLMAAVTTIPIGWLTDRVARVPLLAGSIALWSVAMAISGAAVSFPMLVVTRMFLGAVQATSGPTLASLTGDLFAVRERGSIFGIIHAGELMGAGFGFLVSGEIAAVLSWRWSFWILSIPGLLLAVSMWRGLPEPRRRAADSPDAERRISVSQALRRLLRIRTNVCLIASVTLGYFFLGGARTFGVVFVRGHYHLGQASGTAISSVLGIGALVGVLAGGRLADRLVHRGHVNGRITVSAIGYLAAAALFVPPILITAVGIALPIYVIATAALIAPSAPQDAALLEVIPGELWGRGEGLLTAVRTFGQALAPIMFGFLADVLGSTSSHGFGKGTFASTSTSGADGLAVTFLIMLVPIAAAGLILLWARRTYPHDAARAAARRQALAAQPTGFAS